MTSAAPGPAMDADAPVPELLTGWAAPVPPNLLASEAAGALGATPKGLGGKPVAAVKVPDGSAPSSPRGLGAAGVVGLLAEELEGHACSESVSSSWSLKGLAAATAAGDLVCWFPQSAGEPLASITDTPLDPLGAPPFAGVCVMGCNACLIR